MTIRWKPRSEADGNLVVLANEPFALVSPSGQVIRGTNYGPSNGYRYTVRYPRPGAAYQGVRIKTRAGVYEVPNPRINYGGGRGPELGRGASAAPAARSTPSTPQIPKGGNPLLGTAATLAMANPKKTSEWITKGLKMVKPRLEGLFQPQATTGGLFGGSATPATMVNTAPSLATTFAPWLAGGAVALGIWGDRENPVKRWKGIVERAQTLGRQGGPRPTSDYNYFGLNSIKQDAYDAGKAGKAYNPGKYSNAARANDARRQEAKQAVASQGFTIADIRSRNNGPYTPKEKAAAAIQRRHQTSQVRGNPSLLTDADAGGK